ncbi:hypothetical protein AB0H71_01275 [Nocardia sp. NPDC050697]|uniref:hypothetical protein n=1 Tax=Nocardia sp. NPDC050697 TaxID=3155158 RepID=UPI0033DBF053
MNQVGRVIRELHSAENDLAALLLLVAERHRADQEIFHVGRDLARWSRQHVRELARLGRDLDPVATARPQDSEPPGRYQLLRDLREIHTAAAGVSVDWEILAQAAQALRDPGLLATVQRCHPQTLRQLRWANAHIKASAAQIVVTP